VDLDFRERMMILMDVDFIFEEDLRILRTVDIQASFFH